MTLLFDEHVEQRFLIDDQNLVASIAQCKAVDGGRDLVKKWYLYTRNRSVVLPVENEIEVKLTATGTHSSVAGNIDRYLHDAVSYWISLSGDAACSANELNLTSPHGDRTIRNAADIESFMKWLPSYKPNPKHREREYIAAGGEVVSQMPLSQAEAQKLLLTSLSDQGGTRWAFHKRTSEYYCFPRTHIDQEVFHGFVESENNVPNELRESLKA